MEHAFRPLMQAARSMPGRDDDASLTSEECFALLATVDVGRVAWANDDSRVTVLPVNYAIEGAEVVFRCTSGQELAAVRAGQPISFQVEDTEPVVRAGWTVLAWGRAREVTDPVLARQDTLLVGPWVDGAHHTVIRLRPDCLIGRYPRLHAGGA